MASLFPRTFLVTCVSLGIALIVGIGNIEVQAKTYQAKSGISTRIKGFTSWNGDCSYRPVRLDITRKPKHGSVSPRLQMGRINTVLSGSSKCKGRTIKKVFLYYKSKPGFKGKDNFRIRVRFGSGPQSFTYRINVR